MRIGSQPAKEDDEEPEPTVDSQPHEKPAQWEIKKEKDGVIEGFATDPSNTLPYVL